MSETVMTTSSEALKERYEAVRSLTEQLAAPLSPEDQTVQSMSDVSPTKWHRAHTSWFFETFLLETTLPGYELFHPAFEYLFNSYYEGIGSPYPRPRRGLISRPGVDEIARYRAHVDAAIALLLERDVAPATSALVELGCNHEQQHQELLLMDIKHVLSTNPLLPAYGPDPAPRAAAPSTAVGWLAHEGGLTEIGASGGGFRFDNELPRHTAYLEPFLLADRPVSAAEWAAFIDDGGYRRAELWLSDGWAMVQAELWDAPAYWSERDGRRVVFSLHGERPLVESDPVCHVSYYEADAFARWAGARLPTEQEWEAVAARHAGDERGELTLHPTASGSAIRFSGDVWQWTSSSYAPYPGFTPAEGAVGEYNGKFMVNQYVLRGGACVTPVGHSRASYRNFFPAQARWPFTGLRLARDA